MPDNDLGLELESLARRQISFRHTRSRKFVKLEDCQEDVAVNREGCCLQPGQHRVFSSTQIESMP